MAQTGIQIDTSAYKLLAARLKVADKAIKKEYTKALREVGKPFGQYVLVAAASQLPKKGGLAFRVASSRVNVSVGSMKCTIGLKSREGYDLKKMDSGRLRHPVFPNPNGERTLRSRAAQRRIAAGVSKREDAWTWVEQAIPANVFTQPFNEGAPFIRAEMLAAGERVLQQIAEAAAA